MDGTAVSLENTVVPSFSRYAILSMTIRNYMGQKNYRFIVTYTGKSYSTKEFSPSHSLPVGSYSLPQPSQRNVPARQTPSPTKSAPVSSDTFIAAIRSIVADMKGTTESRDLEYEDYLWRTAQAEKEQERQRLFKAYGG
jgi:hypothetical protein